MQKDKDKNKDKIITSVEIVDVPPKNTETSTILSNELAEVGATQLTKEEVYRLFNGRNLAFVSTLSKDGSPNVTPVWADMENDMILINTSEAAAKKKKCIKRPPYCYICS
jgi:hypothetical protein